MKHFQVTFPSNMKYSKTKTYYAIIEGSVTTVEFMEKRERKNCYGGTYYIYSFGSESKGKKNVFEYEDNKGLFKEMFLENHEVFLDPATAQLRLDFTQLEKDVCKIEDSKVDKQKTSDSKLSVNNEGSVLSCLVGGLSCDTVNEPKKETWYKRFF